MTSFLGFFTENWKNMPVNASWNKFCQKDVHLVRGDVKNSDWFKSWVVEHHVDFSEILRVKAAVAVAVDVAQNNKDKP